MLRRNTWLKKRSIPPEPARDIDTAATDGPKALDPERPIREDRFDIARLTEFSIATDAGVDRLSPQSIDSLTTAKVIGTAASRRRAKDGKHP